MGACFAAEPRPRTWINLPSLDKVRKRAPQRLPDLESRFLLDANETLKVCLANNLLSNFMVSLSQTSSNYQ